MRLDISCLGIVSISILESFLITTHANGMKKEYNISNVEVLNCSENQLTFLPTTLPEGLKHLDCSKNKLLSLPTLPEGLEGLYCSGNQLTSLPKLPEKLKSLCCGYNQLISLPTLPERLGTLDCGDNQLTFLPVLPEEMKYLYCYENPLIYIQYLKKRPFCAIVPSHLQEKHSAGVYQKNYVLQTLSRYLVFFFMRKSKYCNTFRIFETILSESLL